MDVDFKKKKAINFLGVNNFFSDLKELPKIILYIMFALGIIFLFLTFFDFNHFINPKNNPSFFSIENVLANRSKLHLGNSIPNWVNVTLYCLSGVAAFTNTVNVFLVCFRKISNYTWGVFGAIFYGLFAFDFGYTGDAQLYIFIFLPFQFIGWGLWRNNMETKDNITHIEVREHSGFGILFFGLIGIFILTVAWFYEIPVFHKALTNNTYAYQNQFVPHFFDSFTSAVGIVASIMMFMKLKEQWILWIVVNIISIAMFSGISGIGTGNYTISVNQIIQLIILTFNAFIGYMIWGDIIDHKFRLIKKKNNNSRYL